MPRKKIIPESIIQEVINYYFINKSLNLTSLKFGYNSNTIYNLLKSHNVDTKLDKDKHRKKLIKYKIDENYFENIDTSDKAYILGLLYADGHMLKNRKQIRLKLTDIDLLNEVKKRMEYDKPNLSIKKEKEIHKLSEMLIICNTKMYDDLVSHGCLPNKTFNCNLPKLDDNLMNDFIRGFFDGDGSFYIRKNRVDKAIVDIVGTQYFCLELSEYFRKYNINTNIRFDKRHDNRIRILQIYNTQSLYNFYNLIYKNIFDKIFLKRKYEKYLSYIEYKINSKKTKIKYSL